jgi:hypothetical protein
MATNKYDKPTYAYTAGVGKMADDNFDIKGATNSEAEMRFSDVPDQKAMRYMAADEKLSEFLNPKAGSGRGKQGGPTAGELKAKEMDDLRESNAKDIAKKKGISVEKLRKNMSDEYDKKMKAGEFYNSGGKVSSASKRADGCATKGKTKGTMVKMNYGGKC